MTTKAEEQQDLPLSSVHVVEQNDDDLTLTPNRTTKKPFHRRVRSLEAMNNILSSEIVVGIETEETLLAEKDNVDNNNEKKDVEKSFSSHHSPRKEHHGVGFWQRMRQSIKGNYKASDDNHTQETKYRTSKKEDRYFNMAEKDFSASTKRELRAAAVSDFVAHHDDKDDIDDVSTMVTLNIPSLLDCRRQLTNKEAERVFEARQHIGHILSNAVFNIAACIVIYLVNTINIESLIMATNAVMATWYYLNYNRDYDGVKLDFAFLAFSVVFPLTFLVQSTFTRRDQALMRLADFKACILTTSLFTFTVDWPSSSSSKRNIGGRMDLPDDFNKQALHDFQKIIQLVYEYLSMPSVSHARHVVIWSKQHAAKRVYGLQNDIYKRLQTLMFDLSMHTEIMREYGFPSGEASRLHQYHQYLQQRFEQVRIYKYYRTPQATRSFGRAYILILPWISGPYFVWVADQVSDAFALALGGFTFLVLLGLLNAQHSLEDPFVDEFQSLTPGIDNVKLEFEFATVLQSIEQYYANAEMKLSYDLKANRRRSCTD